ncbi:MAG: (d)CMP kinase [Crocinitomicaceae bacterium TMED135]|nr:MAG: (d)CMP kinase [Crocinitomicaceae bacterium TMED135]
MKNTIITIDGHSGCGKSTLAKSLAEELKFLYIDSGAMYRAISLFFLRSDLILEKGELKEGFQEIMNDVKIDFSIPNSKGKSFVMLNSEIIEEEIRGIQISNLVSQVSKNRFVREKMVSIQKSYGKENNLVMDGRDIGSIVFPMADIKFWLTASVEIRAYRRWLEFQKKGHNISIEQVIENINYRDINDENRVESPLVKPDNSIEIDSTNLNVQETYQFALDIIKKHLKY